MFGGGWIPIGEWTARDPFANVLGSPLALYDECDVHIANLDSASPHHTPEAATLSLLALGGLLAVRRPR